MRQDFHHSSGMTLTSVLAAVAIGAVVMLTLATLVNNIFRLSSRTDAIAAVDSVVRTVNSVISDTQLCPNALRTSANGHVPFSPPASAPYAYSRAVDRIAITRPGVVGDDDHVVISTEAPNANLATNVNYKIGENLKISSMTLQEATPGAGRSTTKYGGLVYNVYNAVLVLTFDKINSTASTGFAGGPLATRSIPLVVSVGQGTGTVDYCMLSEVTERHAVLCGNLGTTYSQVTKSCQVTWVPSGNCVGTCSGPNLYSYISGFRADGSAICACGSSAPTSPAPPPLPPPPLPAVTFPSKAKATYPVGSGPSGWGFGT